VDADVPLTTARDADGEVVWSDPHGDGGYVNMPMNRVPRPGFE
jgi:hypothetical protein